jgi:transcription elongation factor Elf1
MKLAVGAKNQLSLNSPTPSTCMLKQQQRNAVPLCHVCVCEYIFKWKSVKSVIYCGLSLRGNSHGFSVSVYTKSEYTRTTRFLLQLPAEFKMPKATHASVVECESSSTLHHLKALPKDWDALYPNVSTKSLT